MAKSNNLYDDVVNITYQYLGPAADRFVVRQIRSHLRKDPSALRPKDLQKLIDWIQLAMRLISNDNEVIDRYIAELEILARNNHPASSYGEKATSQ